MAATNAVSAIGSHSRTGATLLIACIAAIGFAAAQPTEIVFREGLAIKGVAYRAPFAVFVDNVLARFNSNGWKAPRAGETVPGLDGTVQSWKPVQAGDDGTFKRDEYARGWAYFEVESPSPRVMLLHAMGCGAVYADGRPRAADHHAYGYVQLPVKLRKGKTSFMFAPGRELLKARLIEPRGKIFVNTGDPTLPDIVVGKPGRMSAGIILVNATESFERGLKMRARLGNGAPLETEVPPIPPLSHRKVRVDFESPNQPEEGEVQLKLDLLERGKTIDSQAFPIRVRGPYQTRKITFTSDIDGSVQYFAVNPAQTPGDGKPLVMALHGARTEGLEMADDYKGKDWCHIVCATNRRPFGFDWEGTGRRDLLEVLPLAKKELRSDPQRTYLTGHSMGGHGAWINGLMFPDQWAGLAPCAAWVSVFGYWPRSVPTSPIEEILYRAANLSETKLIMSNGLSLPIYMHHGDKDDDVEYSESVRMNEDFKKLGHPNLTFHTMPGAGHWFGTESIDWPGIFDLFKGLKLTSSTDRNSIDFTTLNPASSSKAWWLEILQQEKPLEPSHAHFERRPTVLEGTTKNVAAIAFEPAAFFGGAKNIEIDGQLIIRPNTQGRILLRKVDGSWKPVETLDTHEKNPLRSGPFEEVLKNRFRFVYGTRGTSEEREQNLSLARFHAEDFQVWGNGSIELLSDREFLRIPENRATQTNVVLIGNRDTNAAWANLLSDAPILVRRGLVAIGKKVHRGNDLSCLFVRPMPGSDHALLGVVASTGRSGHGVLERLQFFLPQAHYPDWIVVGAEMYSKGVAGVRGAGFFDNQWKLSASD